MRIRLEPLRDQTYINRCIGNERLPVPHAKSTTTVEEGSQCTPSARNIASEHFFARATFRGESHEAARLSKCSILSLVWSDIVHRNQERRVNEIRGVRDFGLSHGGIPPTPRKSKLLSPLKESRRKERILICPRLSIMQTALIKYIYIAPIHSSTPTQISYIY